MLRCLKIEASRPSLSSLILKRSFRNITKKGKRHSRKPKDYEGSFRKPLKPTRFRRPESIEKIVKIELPDAYTSLLNVLETHGIVDKSTKKENELADTPYMVQVRALQQYFEDNLQSNPSRKDKMMWKSLKEFGKFYKPGPSDTPPLEFLVELLEVAKLRRGETRLRLIKLVCDILYSYGKVRLDPINEIDYLDAMFTYGSKDKANKLWQSRWGRADVQDIIAWYDLGAFLHIKRYDWRKAEEIACYMNEKFQYVSPILMLEFIKLYIHLQRPNDVAKWYKQFAESIEQYGLCEGDKEESKKIVSEYGDLTFEQASQLNNLRIGPSPTQAIQVLRILLQNNYWKLSQEMINDMEKFQILVPVVDMLNVINESTKVSIRKMKKDTKKNGPNRFLRSKRSFSKRQLSKGDDSSKFVPLLSKLISIHPEILNDSVLYQSWLRGLTGLGLYLNSIEVLDAMIARGLSPSLDDVHVLIRALLSQNQPVVALNILQRLEDQQRDGGDKLSGKYPTPTPETYSLFMQHAINTSNKDLLHQANDRMNKKNIFHSEKTFSYLLAFYFENLKDYQKFFELCNQLITLTDLGTFQPGHFVYRTVWSFIRKYYQYHKLDQSYCDLRDLFESMISSDQFRPSSYFILECVTYSMIMSEDYIGASAVLAYMETVHEVRAKSVLAMGILQLAYRMKHRQTKFILRPIPDKTKVSDDMSLPWAIICHRLCQVLENDTSGFILEVNKLSKRFERVSAIKTPQNKKQDEKRNEKQDIVE